VDCIVTLDAGTGSGRCVAFDARGRALASAQARFTYRLFAHPTLPLVRGCDLDADAFWAVLAACVRQVVKALPPDARVRAVIATSQREGCVFLDAAGAVLYAGPNLDGRAVLEGLELEGRLGADRLHAITGHAPPYIFPAARWLWFKKEPGASRFATLLMLNDWITYQLSGERTAEHSSASESMLYDVGARAWSDVLLRELGLPRAAMPAVCEAGATVGRVTAVAAATTGLPEGTLVLAGGADTELALLGSGVTDPGAAGVVMGTTMPIQMVIDRALLDPEGSLWTSAFVLPGRWVLESNAGDTGGAYRWLLELFYGKADAAAHDAAERAMAAVPPEPQEAICHLGPVVFGLKRMNPYHPAGWLFRFPLLDLDRPGRASLLRAFVESVAYAVRGNCEQIAGVAGRAPASLRLSGGMTRVAPLPGLVATVLGRPVEVSAVAESASLGCGILGAVATGLHPSVDDAVGVMTAVRSVEPDAARYDAYTAAYERWRMAQMRLNEWTV
jgi:sugar (pentulose or hexulose) kinase